MGRSIGELSLRDHTAAIRHLDAARARELVGLFRRPVLASPNSLAFDPHDTLTESTCGCLRLAVCGQGSPWPCSTWPTGRNSEVFDRRRSSHPTASDSVDSLRPLNAPAQTNSTSQADTVLAYYQTHLYLHGLLRLPLSVARELALHHGHLYLDKLVSITDNVAQELAGHHGGGLSLNHLQRLSPTSAWLLGRHVGELSLNRLRSLDDEGAVGLAQHANDMFLEGIEKITPRAAAALSLHRGNLHLTCSSGLPDNAAGHLAQHRGKLHLHGFGELSVATAAALGGRSGYLCLRDINCLPFEQAAHLSRHTGPLHFYSLRVDELVARALGQHEGSLMIRVPDTIHLRRLGALVEHQGPLGLRGLRSIDEARASVLVAQPLYRGIEGLSGLFLDDVEQVTPAAVAILATHRAGGLSLNKIPLLTETCAEQLVTHPNLSLNGIRSVTDRIATILARHTGVSLSLCGLESASPSGLARLRANPGIILPDRFQNPTVEPPASASYPHRDQLVAAIQGIATCGEEWLRQSV